MRKLVFFVAAGIFLSVSAHAQDDAPSLGDIARQTRQQKQRKDKDAPAKVAPNQDSHPANTANTAAKPVRAANHVITNEELPAHTAAAIETPETRENSERPEPDAPTVEGGNRDGAAAQWKAQIQSQKEAIAALQQRIASEGDSIHYAGGNCVQNCAQWNERQQQKQQEVETMKAQLEEQQKKLEEMQESARRQGFGSQVYDP
ncbi:MAG TPA: hypothetical protein VGG04_04580 [Candidatus Sulfotelmatobacter sp.]|jgi:hypothetical protein